MRIMLHQLRERIGLTQEEISDRIGCSISMVSRWESGQSNIPSNRLPEIAAAYECAISEIFTESDIVLLPLGPQLSVRGNVAAGKWLKVWENQGELQTFTGRPDISAPMTDRFGVIVEGDSMNEIYPAGTVLECISAYAFGEISSGKRVIVQRRTFSGDIEVTVKELHIDADNVYWLVPRSRNPAFQTPFRVDQPGEDIEEIVIIGVVVSRTIYE